MNMVRRFVAVLWLLLSLGGCSGMGEAGAISGWREATVVGVGSKADLSSQTERECIARGADAPYVVVSYRGGVGGRRPRLLGLIANPADGALQIGDLVRVNIVDCEIVPVAQGRR